MIYRSYVHAIIPAAGLGRRMKISYPKQYYFIENKTILEHSVSTLLVDPRITKIVIVISPEDTYFYTLSLSRHPKIDVVISNRGTERVHSVLTGIQAVSKKAYWILVHDAVRPCLHQNDLERLLNITKNSTIGAILATPVRDTLKYVNLSKNTISYSVNRCNLWHALTPQLFQYDLLKECLLHVINNSLTITDEASSLEHCGFHPILVEGRSDNIKVTNQADLQFVKFYFTQNK